MAQVVDRLIERRLQWLRSADHEFEELGAPVVNLAAAEAYWEDAWERLQEAVLDEYGSEFPENDLLLRITAYDVALLALAMAVQVRDDRWYDVVLGRFLERYDRRVRYLREQRSLRSLPNDETRLSLRGWPSDADPGL
jgi:hypothetical protein